MAENLGDRGFAALRFGGRVIPSVFISGVEFRDGLYRGPWGWGSALATVALVPYRCEQFFGFFSPFTICYFL